MDSESQIQIVRMGLNEDLGQGTNPCPSWDVQGQVDQEGKEESFGRFKTRYKGGCSRTLEKVKLKMVMFKTWIFKPLFRPLFRSFYEQLWEMVMQVVS